MKTFTLEGGQVIVKYSTALMQIEEISDWNGNDLSGTDWEDQANEALEEMK